MLEPAPIFLARKLDFSAGWAIEVVWADKQAEQLVGVYRTKEHAANWIAERSQMWLAERAQLQLELAENA